MASFIFVLIWLLTIAAVLAGASRSLRALAAVWGAGVAGLAAMVVEARVPEAPASGVVGGFVVAVVAPALAYSAAYGFGRLAQRPGGFVLGASVALMVSGMVMFGAVFVIAVLMGSIE